MRASYDADDSRGPHELPTTYPVALLFVHELGHVVEAKRQGLPVSVPVFIPFVGALITLKQTPRDALFA